MKNSLSSLFGAVFALIAISSSFAASPPLRSTRYDGTTAHRISFGSSAAYDPAVTMTIEAWVYRDDTSRCEAIVGRDYTSSYWLGFCGGRVRFYRSGGDSADADRNVTARSWTHVAASYDGTRVWFYVDGQPAGNPILSNAGAGQLETLYLGGDADGFHFQGYLDEVRIWSVARTQPQINGFRLKELAGDEANLVFHQPQGGTLSRGQIFGIIPEDLVIPPAATAVTMDGVVSLSGEYIGAEQLVIRYGSGSGVPDAVAHLVYRASGGQTNLYVGVQNIRDTTGGWPWTNSFFAVHYDPDLSRNPFAQTDDFRIRAPLLERMNNLPRWEWGNAAGGYGGGLRPPSSSWQTANTSPNEFAPPTMEFRVSGNLFEKFGKPFGFAAGHLAIGGVGDDRLGPSGAAWNSPLSWVTVTFGDAASPLPSAQLSGHVYDGDTNRPVASRVVTLYDGTASAVLAVTSTDSSGFYVFHEPVPVNHELKVFVTEGLDDLFVRHEPDADGGGTPPTRLAPWEVTFPGCGSGSCSYQEVNHFIRLPAGPVTLTSFDPTSGSPRYVLRETPLKELAGTEIRIHGTNLHTEIRVYLYSCLAMPPGPGCVEGADYFRAEVTNRAPDESFIDVQVPSVPESMHSGYNWSWVVRDLWSRPGRVEWNRIGGGTLPNFALTEPPYPMLHSFEFENVGDGPSVAEFESVYGDNIFRGVPFPPFRVRNPIYFTLWLPVYFLIGETAGSAGSCHGMAGLSRLFANGILEVDAYDVAGSGGPSGVRYAAGFPSRPMTIATNITIITPVKPADWTGFDFFRPFQPVDVWAAIRTLMMAQFSIEAINNYLDQISVSGGNPVAVLNRLRSNPAGYVLCFNNGGFNSGHCVTPYDVRDGFKLDETDLANGMVTDPDFSIIKVYDNNYPEVERHVEVNHVANQFRYLVDGTTNVWISRSMFTVPLSFFTSGRHAPSMERILASPSDFFFRFLCSGGADAQHSAADGGTWGWDGTGVFTNTYPGAITQFPLFGFNPDRDQRSAVMAHLPLATPPVKSVINVRGTNYLFHAGRRGTTLQLVASDLLPGGADVVELTVTDSLPAHLKFSPSRAIGSLVPQIGQNTEEESVVYSWRDLSLPAGHPIELRASTSGPRGASLANPGGSPIPCSFQVEAVHSPSGLVCNNRYGPFVVPAGASVKLSFPEWPRAVQVVSELDLDDNGSIDRIELLPAELALFVQQNGHQIILRWVSSRSGDVLEATDELGPAARWSTVGVQPLTNGNHREVTLTPGATQQYFRIRSQP